MTKKNGADPGNAVLKESGRHQEFVSTEYIESTALKKPTLLLHSCCGPCSTAVVEALAAEYAITVFFYNPNITDRSEYEKRLSSQIRFIRAFNEDPHRADTIGFLEGEHETQRFYEEVKALTQEPEGGVRCEKCIRLRLEKTAETASLMGFDCFATTLAVSPQKSYEKISGIGRDLCARYGVGFLDRDFKKGGGYQRSVALSKQHGLYRQAYCGCEYAKDRT